MCCFPSTRRRFTRVWEACAVTVGALALAADWDDTTCPFFQEQTRDSTHSGQVLLPQDGKLDVPLQVDVRPYFKRS